MRIIWGLVLIGLLIGGVGSGAQAASLNVAWSDNSTNEMGFNVERKVEVCAGTGAFSPLVSVGVNVTAYLDGAVAEGASYCYRLNAWNTVDGTTGGTKQFSAWSNTAGVSIVYTAASAPTGLAASATGVLSWTDRTTTETGFLVERKPVACVLPGTFTALTTTGAGVISYADTAVTQGATYCYRVAATNALGNSPFSNTAERLVPLVVPVAPGQLGVTVVP
jgi:hypothetical protein